MALMNQSEFARHIGVERGYITQLKTAGRLIMQDGKVDVEASIKKIEETRDPSKAPVAERHAKERNLGKKQPEAIAENSEKIDSYQSSRAKKEKYAALQAQISYEKEIGLLLVTQEAKSAVADGDAIIRNRLESLPDLLAPQLAAESDEQKIRAMLVDHVEQLLGDLSRSFLHLIRDV
jgi:hypothetical protein